MINYSKKFKTNISYIGIWVLLYVMMALPQLFMIAMSSMAVDGGMIEPSISKTIQALPLVLLVTMPVGIPLIYSLIVRKKYTWGNICLIISILIYLFMADMLAPAFGMYSVNSNVEMKKHEKNKMAFEDKHPNKDPNNEHIVHSQTYDWYLNKITGELFQVRNMSTELIDSWPANLDDLYVANIELANGVLLNIISYSDYQTIFNIEGTDQTYITDRNLLIRNSFTDIPKTTVNTGIILNKDDMIISYNKNILKDLALGGLYNHNLTFKLNGEQVLQVNIEDNSYDISVVSTVGEHPASYTQEQKDYLDAQRSINNILMKAGYWEVQLFANSVEWDMMVALSEVLEYEIK